MTGHICLVTGSTHGIGLATAMGLARVGATVVVHGRNAARVETVVETIPGRARQSSGVNPDDACVRAILVSRYREQTLNRYDQDRAPQEEHEIRDDPGHRLPDVGDPSHGVCRDDQRYRR